MVLNRCLEYKTTAVSCNFIAYYMFVHLAEIAGSVSYCCLFLLLLLVLVDCIESKHLVIYKFNNICVKM